MIGFMGVLELNWVEVNNNEILKFWDREKKRMAEAIFKVRAKCYLVRISPKVHLSLYLKTSYFSPPVIFLIFHDYSMGMIV